MQQISVLKEASENDFYHLAGYAFHKEDSQNRRHFFNQLYQNSLAYGTFDSHDQLTSGLLATDLRVNFHQKKMLMSGIGYVASYPEHAGGGAIGQLMQTALTDMYQRGIVLSYLAPFSYGFYRRFGYELTFSQRRHQMQMTDLPKLKLTAQQGEVRRLTLKEIQPLIKTLMPKLTAHQAGGLMREDWWWQYLIDKHSNWECAGYFNADQQLTGYLIYERHQTEFEIHELMGIDAVSRQYLINFVAKHQSAFKTLCFVSADETDYQALLTEPSALSTTVVPYMMSRVVNVEAFLKDYPYQTANLEPVTLAITDDQLPQNTGAYQISLVNHHVTVTKLQVQQADLQLTIQQLTQALMGYRSLKTQYQFSEISGNEAKLMLLNQALIQTKPMLWDYF